MLMIGKYLSTIRMEDKDGIERTFFAAVSISGVVEFIF